MTNTVFKSESQPDWGMGLVVEEGPDHWVLIFEHGGRKKFIKSKVKGLVPVTLEAKALATLQTKANGKHAKAGMKPRAKSRSGFKKSEARFTTFQQQVAFFEKLFEGGFEGEHFTNDERGMTGLTGKAGHITAAIALAREELSAARFDSESPETLFKSATTLLKATNIVFPIDGAIPFAGMEEGRRPAALAGLKQLLHGEGDYALRLERFTRSIELKNKKGDSKSIGWPFATLFGAMLHPETCSCIKPTPFASQAATFGMNIEKAQPVSSSGYNQFHEVAMLTQTRLIEAGHKPRDLMDVCIFIWRTHSEKPIETV